MTLTKLKASPNMRCILIVLLFLNSSLSAEQQHWQSTDFIIDSFVDIALNNEYTTKTSKVRKWINPIYYQIDHRTGDKALHQQLTQTHLAHLASITGLTILPTSIKHPANLKIIFSSENNLRQELQHDFLINDKQQIESLARNGVCLANFSVNSSSNITKAIVIIPVDRARANAKLLSCIVEELTQVLGLPNDSDKVFPSIFNDKSKDDYLSGLDLILLKALYHPSITPGLDAKLVRRQLKYLLDTPEFQQLIIDAELNVRQQGLYKLLN
tara:strand:- start:99271 stop:100080 length:810 start_codon:yes stop_codon:yes gene_type:complete